MANLQQNLLLCKAVQRLQSKLKTSFASAQQLFLVKVDNVV